MYSTDFKTKSARDFQSIVYDLAQKLKVPDTSIQYNWIFLDAVGISYAEKGDTDTAKGFPFMMFACVLVGCLILLAAGLVIYNILKVATHQRIREYGTLRAIGSESRQLYLLVTVQLLILCSIGIPIGIVFGVLSAKGILTAATGLLNPDLFMAETTKELSAAIAENSTGNMWTLLVSIMVTLVFAILAAFPSARYASRVSPTIAMGGRSVNIKRRTRSQKQVYRFEAFYARLNLRRNCARTAITIVSMVMSITVFVALQSFSGLLDTSRAVQDMHLGDYSVTNETVGISPEAVALFDNEMVESLATSKLEVYFCDDNGEFPAEIDFSLHSWESLQIAAMDLPRLISYASDVAEQDLEALQNGTGCLVKNPIPFSYEGKEVERTEFQAGDFLTINGKKLRVVKVVENVVSVNNEGFVNGVQVMTTDAVFDAVTGKDEYSEIYPVLRENANTERFENWLNEWCKENPGSHWLSYQESDAQLAESFEQIHVLCWGLILFIGLIGVLNIINTVYTNIHTRVNEIGMQRAVGMSRQSLYKMFLWEGGYYGLIASLIGSVLGYVCTIFVGAGMSNELQLTAIPAVSIVQAAGVSVTACLLATAIPLRSIARMNIVEAIGTVE